MVAEKIDQFAANVTMPGPYLEGRKMDGPKFDDPFPEAPPTTKRVRVQSGALAGQEGTVIGQRGNGRLLVNLEASLRGICLEINAEMVELLDHPAT